MPFATSWSAHGTKQVGRRVLEGQIEVVGNRLMASHEVDEALPYLPRIQVVEAKPPEPVGVGRRLDQILDGAGAVVASIRCQVLRNEHDLLDASFDET